MNDENNLQIGDEAPDFCLPGNNGKQIALKDYRGKKLLLYFYPKDMTSGCTKQAEALRDHKAELDAKGVAIIGVSKDPPKRHDKFIEKHELNFDLASDETGEMLSSYGVWKEKSMYGKKYMGIERSSFLIDEQGKIMAIFPKVKVPNHIDMVFSALD